jgi:hypothetical protein
MHTQAEIEQSITKHLAILFGGNDSVESQAFIQKYNALVQYVANVSAPFLGPETVRYQSMLLYFSLIFLVLNLFRVGKIKLSEILFTVDKRFLIFYGIFMGAITVIFLSKAYVDYQRARLVRSQNVEASAEVRELITIAMLRKHIQQFFWLEIFDAIGQSYKAYSDAASSAIGSDQNFEPIKMQAFTIDRAALTKIPETEAELKAQESYLKKLISQLNGDEMLFRKEVEPILVEARTKQNDPRYAFDVPSPYDKIKAVYERTLGKWMEARNHLTDVHLDFVLKQGANAPENLKLEAVMQVLRRMVTIRRIYASLEVFVPIAFATATIAYVIYARSRGLL